MNPADVFALINEALSRNSGSPICQRQGDLLIVALPELPDDIAQTEATPHIQGKIVLALGEVTGHSHVIADPEIKWFGKVDAPIQYVEAPHSFTVEHDEHSPLSFGKGAYAIIRQMEATADDLRMVVD